MKKHPLLRPALAVPFTPDPIAQFFRRQGSSGLQQDEIAELPEVIRAILSKPVSFYEEMAKQKPQPGDRPLTNVAFVLDGSGSMETGKDATIEGFNKQVSVARAGAKEAGETTFTDVQFATEVSVRCVAKSIDELEPLTEETYKPDGWTALYDAMGDTVAALLGTPRIDSPLTATLVTLFTDGKENVSSRYTADVLSELIKRLEATGRWTFALVGPKGSVGTLAETLSVKKGNVKGYNPSSVHERQEVFGAMASASTTYMASRSVGATQSASFFADVPQGADKTP